MAAIPKRTIEVRWPFLGTMTAHTCEGNSSHFSSAIRPRIMPDHSNERGFQIGQPRRQNLSQTFHMKLRRNRRLDHVREVVNAIDQLSQLLLIFGHGHSSLPSKAPSS